MTRARSPSYILGIDFPERREGAEPYQNEQHKVGYCSDKCFDEAISKGRPEYNYDEKGRRFENGVRKPFADPPPAWS